MKVLVSDKFSEKGIEVFNNAEGIEVIFTALLDNFGQLQVMVTQV